MFSQFSSLLLKQLLPDAFQSCHGMTFQFFTRVAFEPYFNMRPGTSIPTSFCIWLFITYFTYFTNVTTFIAAVVQPRIFLFIALLIKQSMMLFYFVVLHPLVISCQDQMVHRHYRQPFHSIQYSFLLQLKKMHFHCVLAESLKCRIHNNYLCIQTVNQMQYSYIRNASSWRKKRKILYY